MGYAVVHMMKIKAGFMGGIQSHNNREHHSKTNPDIDPERTKENYDLKACENYRTEFNRKVSNLVEGKKAVRKDAVAVCNFIVTSDKDTITAMGTGRQRAFFEDSLKWFSDRYGTDRILNATVHMDETTPHLHIGVVPITTDGRLSAKSIFTKKELSAIQTEFARDVGAKYGLERGVEGSERTHLSETRFKLQTASQELSEALTRLETVKGDINTLKAEKNRLQGEIKAMMGYIEALKEKLTPITKHAAAKLLRIQERLDQALERMPERSKEDFKTAWASTKDITLEQAVRPKGKEKER